MSETIAIRPIINIFNSREIRYAVIEDELHISAQDTMMQLGYANARDAWRDMKKRIEVFFPEIKTAPTMTKGGVFNLHYLNQEQLIAVFLKSDRPEAAPFFRWAVSVIKSKMEELRQPPALVKDERFYHQKILDYANYSRIKLVSEQILDNTLNSSDGCKSRRTDFLRILPRCLRVYELKAHAINAEDVSRTLANKGYLSLLAQTFNRPIDFVFLSPYGITDDGRRLIELISNGKYNEYSCDSIQFRAKLRFQHVQELAKEIRSNIIRNTPAQHRWQIERYIDCEHLDILNYPDQPGLPVTPERKVIEFPIKRRAAA